MFDAGRPTGRLLIAGVLRGDQGTVYCQPGIMDLTRRLQMSSTGRARRVLATIVQLEAPVTVRAPPAARGWRSADRAHGCQRSR
jgi:hypothetical protein